MAAVIKVIVRTIVKPIKLIYEIAMRKFDWLIITTFNTIFSFENTAICQKVGNGTFVIKDCTCRYLALHTHNNK